LAFSFQRAMDHAGAVLGPIIAILCLYTFLGHGLWKDGSVAAGSREMLTMRWLFGATLIPSLIAMAILVLKVREISPKQQKIKQAPSLKVISDPPMPKKFYFFLGTVTLFALGNSSDLFLLLYGKTKFQLDLLYVVGLWVVLHISKIIFSFPGGLLSDKFGRRVVIVTGWIIYAFVYLGMAVVTRQSFFWILIVIYGAYYGMTEGAERALVADYVQGDYRGRAYGLYHAAVGLAALPASLLFGIFWVELSPQLAFATGAVLAAIAAVSLTVLLAGDQKVPKYA